MIHMCMHTMYTLYITHYVLCASYIICVVHTICYVGSSFASLIASLLIANHCFSTLSSFLGLVATPT